MSEAPSAVKIGPQTIMTGRDVMSETKPKNGWRNMLNSPGKEVSIPA
ncbi:hypothetical protein SDC9_212619 [bioreactor metagenome]|uniref:Uncharacterized protein n=1 Tax=bioreactor metagenome TaxID=1076179 RepID=A0A645JMI4_9ZZZZ